MRDAAKSAIRFHQAAAKLAPVSIGVSMNKVKEKWHAGQRVAHNVQMRPESCAHRCENSVGDCAEPSVRHLGRGGAV